MKNIQYTVRGIPERIDEVLRKRAVREGTSLTAEVLDALAKGLGMYAQPTRYDDLDDLAGTWVHDPEFDRAIEQMDSVDKDLFPQLPRI